jgi:hypothetical protein
MRWAPVSSPVGSFLDLRKYFVIESRMRGFSCLIHQSSAHASLLSMISSFEACSTSYDIFPSESLLELFARSATLPQKDLTCSSSGSYSSR